MNMQIAAGLQRRQRSPAKLIVSRREGQLSGTIDGKMAKRSRTVATGTPSTQPGEGGGAIREALWKLSLQHEGFPAAQEVNNTHSTTEFGSSELQPVKVPY